MLVFLCTDFNYVLSMTIFWRFCVLISIPTQLLLNCCIWNKKHFFKFKSIKKWRKITTTKNQIHCWPFIYKPGEHRQQSKGGNHTQNYEPNGFDRMRVKQFLSETVAMHPQYWSLVVRVSATNPIPDASDAMVGRCRSTMRRLDNLKR
jgi:hypothetical protein